MNKTIVALFVSLCLLSTSSSADTIESFGSGANQFTMTFVPIGNPGNAPDTTGNPNPAGSVGYHYRMGKYEVSRDMITKANAAGNLGITLEDMVDAGIPTGNDANRPATGVSWNEAARYVNWLNTSNGYSPAYKFATQPGDVGYSSNAQIQLWQISDPGYNAANLFRNSQARYFLPSMDEWYKAAYYDPNANGGAGGYWNFPTGSDSAPTPVSGGTAPGTAVHSQPFSQGPADITNAGGLSPYMVMGMGGNVLEWEETESDLVNNSSSSSRGLRGGGWNVNSGFLPASFRSNGNPLNQSSINLGFRVASVVDSSVTNTHVIHTNWTGSGSPIDNQKSLALEGLGLRTLTTSNLSNSTSGINGLLLDVQYLGNPGAINLEDFQFQMSPQSSFSELLNPPTSWVDAPNPAEISVSPHPSETDTSRILIRWNNSQIVNRWLRLTIKASANTRLLASQTYYLGHLLGETTGSEAAAYTVSFSDISLIRQAVGNQVDASSVVDIDKNGVVSFADISAMRSNIGTVLTNITVP